MATARTARANAAPASARVRSIVERLEKAHPDAKLDLDFTTPLELLVALILAAQARDDLVNQVTPELFRLHRAAADYAAAPLARLQRRIARINFYRNKARSIKSCCKALVERFGGNVPDRLEDLLTLPGVGRKTANIVLGNAFGKQAIGVDTHIMRLSQRLGLTKRSDPDKIEAELTAIVPEKGRVRFCHLLQYHGRRVCFARKPDCPGCTIRGLCPFPNKTPSGAEPKRRQP